MEVPPEDMDCLIAVAQLYVNAFREDEMMSLTEKLALQEVEAVVERWTRSDDGTTTTGSYVLDDL